MRTRIPLFGSFSGVSNASADFANPPNVHGPPVNDVDRIIEISSDEEDDDDNVPNDEAGQNGNDANRGDGGIDADDGDEGNGQNGNDGNHGDGGVNVDDGGNDQNDIEADDEEDEDDGARLGHGARFRRRNVIGWFIPVRAVTLNMNGRGQRLVRGEIYPVFPGIMLG